VRLLRGSVRGRTYSVSLRVLFEVISGLLYLCKAGILTKLQMSELSMEANEFLHLLPDEVVCQRIIMKTLAFGTLVGYRVLVT
jgi:hypothetical protein